MSDEPTPDPMGALFDSREVNPFDSNATPHVVATPVPVAPQFTSRRELRDSANAGAKGAKRQRALRPVRPSQEAAREARVAKATRRELSVRPTAVAKSTRPAGSSASATGKKAKKHPIMGALVLLAVPAFILSASLPAALASKSPGDAANAAMMKTADRIKSGNGTEQVVPVNAAAKTATVQRDKLGATTNAELAAQRVTAAAFATVGPRAAGDDYPWASAGGGLSPLNYYYRQCVDFVAWRLNRDAGVTSAPWKYVWSNLTPNGGSASEWKSAWEHHGWKTSSKPVIGAVAWFQGNHVAYVKSISGGNVTIEEYNGMSSRAYAIRTIPSSTVARFLYPPPR